MWEILIGTQYKYNSFRYFKIKELIYCVLKHGNALEKVSN